VPEEIHAAMIPTAVAAAVVVTLTPHVELPARFWGITPEVTEADLPRLKRKRDGAVVLLHGLLPRPLHPERAEQPDPHSWQAASGALVKGLAADHDVFGFSYAQTGPVDAVALSAGLRDGVAALKAAGYTRIALVGHSAGGIVARRFAELFPDAGVTKVVTVASPHLGSGLASLPAFALPKTQVAFIRSMLPEAREAQAKEWACVAGKDVEFCCVVCKLPRLDGDTVVGVRSQWSDDLQKQGVPAVLVGCNHFEAMTCERGVKAVVDVTNGRVVRWSAEETAKARTALFGEREEEGKPGRARK
jgi:pimeloyl-ACP methyl ester carboxylesterase